MKYSLPAVIGTECRNSGIDHIWVLDADSSNYFYWNDSSLPKLHILHDPKRIAVSAAANGLSMENAGICVFPSASALLESFHALHSINDARIPLFVICFVDEPNTLPENKFLTLLGASNFFVRSVTEPSRVDSRIASSLQYAISQKCVSVLLIDRSLNSSSYEKCWRYKVHRTTQVTIPPDDVIKDLAELINQTDRITIFCGKQCEDSISELQQLTELLKSPLVYAPSIRKAIQGNISYEAGIYGKWSERSAVDAIRDTDLILLLDYSDKDFDLFPSHPKIIQLTPYHLSGIDATKRTRIYRGDIKASLQKLLPLLEKKNNDAFAVRYTEQYKKNKESLQDSIKQDSSNLSAFIKALEDQLTRDMVICSYGYHSYLMTNFLLKPKFKSGFEFPHILLKQGGAIFEAVGLNGGNSKQPAIVILDAGRLYDELSSLMPLTNMEYPIKLCIINQRSTHNHSKLQTLSYQDAAQNLQIPYFSINESVATDKVVNEWINSEGGAILELFDIDTDGVHLLDTDPIVSPVFSPAFEAGLYESFVRLHAGKCFYCKDSLVLSERESAKGLNTYLNPFFTNESIFYAAVGASKTSTDIPVCI
ncbi:MAG: hypothetical protein ACRCSQ_02615, partial [Bacteroidales bacterium]